MTEMLSMIWGVLGIARHAMALVILTGATTGLVAGSLDANSTSHATATRAASAATVTASKTTNTDLEALVKECLSSKDPQSDTCARAMDKSGLAADEFWARLALSLSEQVNKRNESKHDDQPVTAPKADDRKVPTGQLIGLVTACVNSHERSSEPCQKALDLSGLSADEFWAKVGPKRESTKPVETPKPADKPEAKPQGTQTVSDADLIVTVKDCFAKYTAATAAKGNEDLGRAADEACTKAVAASGLISSQFWAKFGTPQSPKI